MCVYFVRNYFYDCLCLSICVFMCVRIQGHVGFVDFLVHFLVTHPSLSDKTPSNNHRHTDTHRHTYINHSQNRETHTQPNIQIHRYTHTHKQAHLKIHFCHVLTWINKDCFNSHLESPWVNDFPKYPKKISKE